MSKIESICTNCKRWACESGQHAGCDFVEQYGKDKTPPYLRQEFCGIADPDHVSMQAAEKNRRIYERRKRTQARLSSQMDA